MAAVRPIPTPRLIFFFALGMVPLALATQVPAVRWAALAYDVGLILFAAADFWQTPAAALTFERQVAARLAIGERELVTILAQNNAMRAVVAQVRDDPPPAFVVEERLLTLSLPARSRARGVYAVRPPARGDYTFAGFTVRVGGPLGLVQRQWRVPHPTPVQVYPNFRQATRMELMGRRSHLVRTGLHSLRRRGEGRTFESLRDYVGGDDTRYLDWKATARRGKLIVRQYEVERHQNIMLMVDAGRMMAA